MSTELKWEDAASVLNAAAAACEPFEAELKAAWKNVSDAASFERVADAAKKVNDAIEPFIVPIARATNNALDNIRLFSPERHNEPGQPAVAVWFVGNGSEPSKFLRDVAKWKSFNQQFIDRMNAEELLPDPEVDPEGPHGRPVVYRAGTGRMVKIRAYAAGDGGKLSFVASLVEDSPRGQRGASVSPGPSRKECLAACPPGFELRLESGYWRAVQLP